MVTKLDRGRMVQFLRSVLAKILMVTKRTEKPGSELEGSVLAKILMVTKHSYST